MIERKFYVEVPAHTDVFHFIYWEVASLLESLVAFQPMLPLIPVGFLYLFLLHRGSSVVFQMPVPDAFCSSWFPFPLLLFLGHTHLAQRSQRALRALDLWNALLSSSTLLLLLLSVLTLDYYQLTVDTKLYQLIFKQSLTFLSCSRILNFFST